MIKNENLDAIIVTVSWNAIDNIILPLLKNNIPCFIEEPIAITSNRVEKIIDLINLQKTHIQIGYNRRFYSYIPEIKEYIKNNTIRSVVVNIPEPFDSDDINLGRNLWIQNSTHVLDLLKLFFGNYFIKSKNISRSTNIYNYDTFNLLLSTNNGFPIHLIANWNTPSNYEITINFKKTIIKLSPLEFGYLYDGFDIVEPTADKPIRQYNPRIKKEFHCSNKKDSFKPGFLCQHKYFLDLLDKNEKSNFTPTNLEDFLFYTKFVENIYSLIN